MLEHKKLYYGDLHNHCDVSYAHGPLKDALENARTQLDFCSITGHADWPDMPERDERIDYIIDFHEKGFEKLRQNWPHYVETMEDYNKDGHFITFPGYEIHSCDEGDYTIIYKDKNAPLTLGKSITEVKSKLISSHGPEGVFAFPHHLGYPHGSRGVNWNSFSPDITPALEILSMHGIAERCESERPFYHSMGPIDMKGTAQFGLSQGHVFGFLGNTDHHSGYPGSYGHGKTGVWADDLSRESIWDALYARRTFAMTGDNIALKFGINNHPMGAVLPDMPERTISYDIRAGYPVDKIEIIKNNRLLESWTPKSVDVNSVPNGEFQTKLYLELGWGEKHKSTKWDVKIALKGAKINKIEPRFRGLEVVSPVEKKKGMDIPYRNGNFKQSAPDKVHVNVTSIGNSTNTTPTTQGICLDITANKNSEFHLTLNGHDYVVTAQRLLKGSYARNLGTIDSPAFRLHRLARSQELHLAGSINDKKDLDQDFYYLRMRQKNNQMAFSSPIFIGYK